MSLYSPLNEHCLRSRTWAESRRLTWLMSYLRACGLRPRYVPLNWFSLWIKNPAARRCWAYLRLCRGHCHILHVCFIVLHNNLAMHHEPFEPLVMHDNMVHLFLLSGAFCRTYLGLNLYWNELQHAHMLDSILQRWFHFPSIGGLVMLDIILILVCMWILL